MVAFLNWLDKQLSGLVGLVYVLSEMIALAAYFGGRIPDFLAANALGLAIAVTLHIWVQTRHFRVAHDAVRLAPLNDPRRPELVVQRRSEAAQLVLLAALDVFANILFLAGNWQAVEGTLVPDSIQYIMRGTIVPLLIILSGFLTPLSENAARVVNDMHSRDLRHLLRVLHNDLRKRIRAIRKRNRNIAPVVVGYCHDLGLNDIARRIRLVDEGISDAEAACMESGRYVSTGLGDVAYVEREPKYRRSPVAIERYRRQDRTAEQARSDAEVTVRRLLASNPKMTRQELMKRGGVSMGDVDHWRQVVLDEMGITPKKRTAHKPKKRKTA